MIGKAKIYGCGGTGINLAKRFLNRAEQPGFAVLDPVFVDTSRSNLTPEIPEEKVYVLSGDADGSGKVRAANADRIVDAVPEVLLEFKPAEFNIVVFSLGGGYIQ